MRKIALLAVLLYTPLCHGQFSDPHRIANALEDINRRGVLADVDRTSRETTSSARLEQQMLAAGQNIQALQQMLRAQVAANQKLQNNFDIVNNRLRKLENRRGMSTGVPAPAHKDIAALGTEYYKKSDELFLLAGKSMDGQAWATAINYVYAYLPEEERPKVYMMIEKPVDK